MWQYIRLLVVVCVCSEVCAWTEPLGIVAPVLGVAEPDLETVWQQQAEQAWHQGRYQRWLDQRRKALQAWLEQPTGRALPTTRTCSRFTVDPAVVLSHDVRDQNGHLWYAAGTRVNPLAYMSYRKVLCFINADDPAQWDWLHRRCAQPVIHRWILVEGPFMHSSQQHAHRLYFDQYGRLALKFHLQSVPARVYQTGNLWQVDEEPVDAVH